MMEQVTIENPVCPDCGGPMRRNGFLKKPNGKIYQKYACKNKACGRTMIVLLEQIGADFIGMDKHENKMVIPKMGLTIDQLRAKHDLNFIVSKTARELAKDVFYTEHEFLKLSGVKAGSGFRMALDNPELSRFKGRVQGITYWSHPESIKKMKEDGVLI
jgi:hypothetical protein